MNRRVIRRRRFIFLILAIKGFSLTPEIQYVFILFQSYGSCLTGSGDQAFISRVPDLTWAHKRDRGITGLVRY
jgi:hypothetical protein